MLILPAIDLMGGQVVRLRQGLKAERTVYSSDPVAMARRWEEDGGDWLHLVDLDGAFEGAPRNLAAVRGVTGVVSIPCELGGGMRTAEDVEAAFAAGVRRVILGTRAARSIDFVRETVERHGAERVAVGIDARDGIVAVEGWTQSGRLDAVELARAVEGVGVRTVIYTDIATDGMLVGPNVAGLERIMGAIRCGVIASGGVSSEADVRMLEERLPGLHGVIIGKALYDGRIDLRTLSGR